MILAAIAVGANAFTKTELKQVGKIYVWVGTAFVQVDSYLPENCTLGSQFRCAYVVTAADEAVIRPETLLITQALPTDYINSSIPKLAPLQIGGADIAFGIYTPEYLSIGIKLNKI